MYNRGTTRANDRQTLSENKVHAGKHNSDRLRVPSPLLSPDAHRESEGPATVRLVHVVHVGLEVQEVHAERLGEGGGIVGTTFDVMERPAHSVTHTFSRVEANKARAPSDVHNGDGGDDTVVHSAGQPSGPAHSSDKQQRTAHTALWSLHNACV